MKSYRLTTSFIVTSLIVIAVAATVVNLIVGRLAEDNLIRIAEDHTVLNAMHIQSMIRMGQPMGGKASSGEASTALDTDMMTHRPAGPILHTVHDGLSQH